MTLQDDILNILKKYLKGEDITMELSELLVKVKDIQQTTSPNKKTREYLNNYKDINKVAYFLSLYDHNEISVEVRPTLAIRDIASKLNVKENTLRNKRDMYDAKIKEKKEKEKKKYDYLVIRNGWRSSKVDLPPKLKEVFEECKTKTHDQLLAEVKQILDIK